MKTQKDPNRRLFSFNRMVIYMGILLLLIVTLGFVFSKSHSNSTTAIDEIRELEIRLARALEPVPDPPPDLEEWMLLFDDGGSLLVH